MQSFQLSDPIDAVIFDCDGTLSLIEGIEVLAHANGVGDRVKELTLQAMSYTGMSPELYRERIELVRPTRAQVIDLAQRYYASRVPGIVSVIEVLQALGKTVYVVSSGVNPAVTLFATMLGIPADQVLAVKLAFSTSGDYLKYDESSVLTSHSGKQVIAQQLKATHKRLIWMGDGMNDVVVKDEVVRFLGFGAARYRENVAKNSDYYITAQSMTPILPLCLTGTEVDALTGQARVLYQEGVALIESSTVECHEM